MGAALAQPAPGKLLVVGSEEDYPPFALGKTDEAATGFTVDLWKAVAAESGLNYTIRVRPFRQILDEFKAGKIDVLINLAQSADRHVFADFSVPHVVVNGAIFVRDGESAIRSEADFAGKSIIVLHSDLAHDYAVSKGWEKQLVLVDTAADGLKLLASGQHDAMLLSKLAGMQTLLGQKIRNLKALEAKAGFSQKFSFAVQEGNAELLAKINEGLALAKSNGTYDALYEKWFGVFEAREVNFRNMLKYLGPITAAFLIFTAFLLIRQYERKKIENRLRDSEERLRLALTAAQQGLYDLNVQTGECIVSPEYAIMLGYDPAEFRETNVAWRERLHPEDREPVYAAYSDYVAGHRAEYRVEFRQRMKDGNWKWILSLGSVVARSADGRPLRMLGTHTDITERKRAVEALEFSEKRFRTLTENAPVGIYLTDEKGDCVYVNRRWCEASGMTPEEASGQGWLNALHEGDRTSIREQWKRSVQSGGAWAFEYRFQNRAGLVTWVYGTAAPILATNGTVVGYVGTNIDITARKRAEKAHQEGEAQLREAQRIAGIGSWEHELGSDSVTWSEGLHLILGHDPGLGPPTFPTLSRWYTPDSWKRLKAVIAKAIETGTPYELELEMIRADGTNCWTTTRGEAVRGPGGAVVKLRGTVHDITERKRAAEAMRETEERLRESQKLQAIGQLAGGVAHDFNNILAAMIMQAELSRLVTNLPGEAREGLERILDYAQRAANLVRQLLLFSRRQVMQPRELNLNEVVTHLAQMLQRIIGEDVHLELQLHSTPLITRADAGMLDQVLLNLAVNARDAMPEGGRLRIETAEKILDEQSVRVHPDRTSGRYVWLSVSDTGRGIPPEVLPRIFEPFFTTKALGKGTGLGLATVFGIVKQHGGWLTVSSAPGQGANFQVFLPASETTPEALPAAAAQPAARRGTETILLVEDELAVRTAARAILRQHGYQVLEAANGLEALDLWQEHRGTVALLLTDLVMPGGVSGQQLAQRLQVDQPGLRVVIMSGYSAEIAGRELKLPTGESFLEKPFASDQLLKTVRHCLDE